MSSPPTLTPDRPAPAAGEPSLQGPAVLQHAIFMPRPDEPLAAYAARLRAMHYHLTRLIEAVERGMGQRTAAPHAMAEAAGGAPRVVMTQTPMLAPMAAFAPGGFGAAAGAPAPEQDAPAMGPGTPAIGQGAPRDAPRAPSAWAPSARVGGAAEPAPAAAAVAPGSSPGRAAAPGSGVGAAEAPGEAPPAEGPPAEGPPGARPPGERRDRRSGLRDRRRLGHPDRRRGLPDTRASKVERRVGPPDRRSGPRDRRLGHARRIDPSRAAPAAAPVQSVDTLAIFWAVNIACWLAIVAVAMIWGVG